MAVVLECVVFWFVIQVVLVKEVFFRLAVGVYVVVISFVLIFYSLL